jgi:hypothetical protein
MEALNPMLNALRIEEAFQFFTEFKEEAEYFGPDKIGLKELFDKFVAFYEKADKLLLVLRASSYTHELETADKKRDDIFRGFSGVVNASLRQPDEAKQKAAERLSILLKGYRKAVLKESYAAESAALYNLLQDLGGHYKADVTLLGFTDWVTAIKEAEQTFLAINKARAKESYEKPRSELIVIRSKMNKLYKNMTNVLDARLVAADLGGDVDVDPEDLDNEGHFDGEEDQSHELHGNLTYNFVVAWNERVKKYRNLVAQRAGRRGKKEEPPAPEA